jgi:hypothetical protein
MYLLGFSSTQDALWRLWSRSRKICHSTFDAPRMRDLMRKYKDLPMDLADAALVRVAEQKKLARIFRSTAGTSTSIAPAASVVYDHP